MRTIKSYAKQYCLDSIAIFILFTILMVFQLFNCKTIVDYITTSMCIVLCIINIVLCIRDYKKIKYHKLNIRDIMED